MTWGRDDDDPDLQIRRDYVCRVLRNQAGDIRRAIHDVADALDRLERCENDIQRSHVTIDGAYRVDGAMQRGAMNVVRHLQQALGSITHITDVIGYDASN